MGQMNLGTQTQDRRVAGWMDGWEVNNLVHQIRSVQQRFRSEVGNRMSIHFNT